VSGRWQGLRPGKVVSAADPERRGRVRVRVPEVYGADEEEERVPDDALPWAMPCFPFAWAPEQGSQVWVAFWQGSEEYPVWLGGWYAEGEAPAEFASSYVPEPTAYVVKTPNGHKVELRWTPGQEKVTVQSAAGLKVELDDLTQTVTVLSPGPVNVQATGPVTIQGGTIALTSLAALTLAATIMTFTGTGLMTLTGAGLLLLTTAAAVKIGAAGATRKLVDERFLTLFNAHTHTGVTPGGGATGPPAATAVPPSDYTTTNVEAN
jgi:phage baseplate assembly protein gpV